MEGKQLIIRMDAIRDMPRFIQAKCLDFSKWQGVLPRGIGPTDIDMVFDNAGTWLACDVKLNADGWKDVPRGQRRAFQALCRGGNHYAAVCSHSVQDTNQAIDTRHDIDAFWLMADVNGQMVESRIRHDNGQWQQFVDDFFEDTEPDRIADLVYKYTMPCK